MTGTCILCLHPVELSSEHIFPEAIGGGLEVPAVCAPCNSFLGSEVDVLLTDDPLVKMIRSGLGLQSKSGSVPAPLRRGELIGHDGALGSVHVRPDGTHEVKPELSRQESMSADGRRQVHITGAKHEVEQAFRTMMERAERNGQKLVILEETEQTVRAPVVRRSWLSGVVHLVRPLLKIAYELTVGWLGSTYLSDPQAGSIRNCIASGTVFDIDAEIRYFPVTSIFADANLPSTDHAAALIVGDGWIRCAVRIFNVIEAVVLVTEQRDRYPHAPEAFLALDSVGGVVRERLPEPATLQRGKLEWMRNVGEIETYVVKTYLDSKMTYEIAAEVAVRSEP